MWVDKTTLLIDSKDDPIVDKIKDTLEKVAVFIRKDGGDISFKGYDKNTKTVFVQLSGACEGCMLIDSTISGGVEAILQQEVDGVNQVKVVDSDYNIIETHTYGWY